MMMEVETVKKNMMKAEEIKIEKEEKMLLNSTCSSN
jgi:hypothetical protein